MSRTRTDSLALLSSDPHVQRSLRHSVRDGVACSIMSGAGEAYFAAYALFLGATAMQISLLAALPPLFGAATQLLAAWLEGRIGRRRTLIVTAGLMHALTWFPLIWLPYLFPAYALSTMVSCIVLYYGWIGLGSPLLASLLGDLVPRRRRGRFFGLRNRVMSLSSFAALLAGGLTLEYLELRDNAQLAFVLIFTVAGLARLYSVFQLARMHEPPLRPLAPLARPVLRDARFVRFAAFTGAMSLALAVAGPFVAVYMLKDLGFSYVEFAAATGAFVLAQFVSLRVWGRLADVFGNRAVLSVTSLLIPLVPLAWLLSSGFVWVLCLQLLAGWAWAGYGLALGNYLHDIVPSGRRAHYWAAHNFLSTAGACLGALLGGWLSVRWPAQIEVLGRTFQWESGLWGLLLVSALLRALVLGLFVGRLQEPRGARAVSARLLVCAMIRFSRPTRFVFERLRGYRRSRDRRAAANELDA